MSVQESVHNPSIQEEEAPPGAILEVALLAYPVVLQTLAETGMHVIDTAMIGKLGTTALGACGFSGTWIWTLLVPFAGIASGVQTFVARHDGAKERNQCGGWVWQAFWMGAPAITLWSALIVLFLQWRPAGLFVTRSRSLD